MKLNEILKAINEEYHKTIKTKSGSLEIFQNPTSKDLKDMPGEIRFIIDFNKKVVYAFDGNVLHYEVASDLGIDYYPRKDFIFGEGINNKTNIVPTESTVTLHGPKGLIKIMIDMDWSFADKYFSEPIKKFLKEL